MQSRADEVDFPASFHTVSRQQPTAEQCCFSQRIRIWSVNTRKLLRRKAELEARLLNANVDLLFLQETWLSESAKDVQIEGYTLVGRLDRLLGPKHGFGGVAIYALSTLTCVAKLEVARSLVGCLPAPSSNIHSVPLLRGCTSAFEFRLLALPSLMLRVPTRRTSF